MNCPRIIIAGTGSGVGKTSVSLGLTLALRRRGLRVQTFKVGPDFLDPSYLAAASGRKCYNLDGWMTSREYIEQLFSRTCRDADIALIEGAMGLFDGASSSTLEGSAAEIAAWLGAPVILVVNAHGMSQSLAAVVKGFTCFSPDVRIAGVIANHAGSTRHAQWLADALKAHSLPKLVGTIPRGELPALQSRHLGLVSADHDNFSATTQEALANAIDKHTHIDSILSLARDIPITIADRKGRDGAPVKDVVPSQRDSRPSPSAAVSGVTALPKVKIGLAFDHAFHFYYPDSLEELERNGCELIKFSPLDDKALPTGISGLYLGGGYPEACAEKLSQNNSMLESIRAFAHANHAIYAECGGLMYLSRGIEMPGGTRYPMLGILPAWTRMTPRLRTLGYAEVELKADSMWGTAGTKLRGHEFHYSELVQSPLDSAGWSSVYNVTFRRSEKIVSEGFQNDRILASYVHLASQPAAARHFAAFCERKT